MVTSTSHTNSGSVSLYQRREKLFVHYVGGHFQTIRLYTGWPLLLGYFSLPWINWQDRQAVLFDLPARKFYLFGLTLWPQDFMLLAWLLIIAAFSLFLVTSLVGRLWCGYTCPQTVWTAIFLWIEKKCEGSSNQRRRLDRQSMSFNKLTRRATKHAGWLSVALATGFTFVAYFTPARQLLPALTTLEASFWSYAWIVFFTVATYVNAGWLREQVCIYMCPYARFQSAMIDRDTWVVTYDTRRGEPRGPRKRSQDQTDSTKPLLGDCVDCQLCVQVCPTGIDIRQGLQIECIQCAHCIDACNQVMDKMKYPQGLIRYDTEANILSGRAASPNYLRPRTVGYLLILLVMVGLFATKLGTRLPFAADVLRDRGELYHLNGTRIVNDYTLKVSNKSQSVQYFDITLAGIGSLELPMEMPLEVDAGNITTTSISVFLESTDVRRPVQDIELVLCEQSTRRCHHVETRFLSPDRLVNE